jgi:hypothetical protein
MYHAHFQCHANGHIMVIERATFFRFGDTADFFITFYS